MSQTIKILELFGGIGASRAALRNLGIPVKSIDYVEIDEKAVRSYNAMFKNDMHQKVQDVRGWNLKPDILVHGSPCQDFSIAGKQQGADEGSETRSSLMWETIRIIENMGLWKPRVVIWENVRNVLSKHMKKNFDRYLIEMERMGYVNAYRTLNAMDYGLPQNRQRVFTISVLGGPAFDFDRMQKRPMRPLSEFLENNWSECHVVKSPSMLSRIGKTDSKTFSGIIKVLDEKGPCECITTSQDRCPNSGVVKLPDGKYRLLTERECWRLQGFIDADFDAANSATKRKSGMKSSALYKQAGNSMPVPVLESMFEVILKDDIKPYLVTQPSILRGIGGKSINRATVINDSAMTITCRQDRCPAQVLELAEHLYRFLTEKECWRLMGFSDEDFEAAKSATVKRGKYYNDLYKQAGNSMPVTVLEEIFRALMKGETPNDFNG